VANASFTEADLRDEYRYPQLAIQACNAPQLLMSLSRPQVTRHHHLDNDCYQAQQSEFYVAFDAQMLENLAYEHDADEDGSRHYKSVHHGSLEPAKNSRA